MNVSEEVKRKQLFENAAWLMLSGNFDKSRKVMGKYKALLKMSKARYDQIQKYPTERISIYMESIKDFYEGLKNVAGFEFIKPEKQVTIYGLSERYTLEGLLKMLNTIKEEVQEEDEKLGDESKRKALEEHRYKNQIKKIDGVVPVVHILYQMADSWEDVCNIGLATMYGYIPISMWHGPLDDETAIVANKLIELHSRKILYSIEGQPLIQENTEEEYPQESYLICFIENEKALKLLEYLSAMAEREKDTTELPTPKNEEENILQQQKELSKNKNRTIHEYQVYNPQTDPIHYNPAEQRLFKEKNVKIVSYWKSHIEALPTRMQEILRKKSQLFIMRSETKNIEDILLTEVFTNAGGKRGMPRRKTYESMTVEELKDRCKKRKIPYSNRKKAELIKLLRGKAG